MAAMLAMVAALVGAAATAQSPVPAPGLPPYLALGDSIATGQQGAPMADDDWATVEAFQAAGYVVQYREVLAAECDGVPDQGPAAGPGCRHLQLLNLARSAPAKVRPPDGRPGVTELRRRHRLAASDPVRAHGDRDGLRRSVIGLTREDS